MNCEKCGKATIEPLINFLLKVGIESKNIQVCNNCFGDCLGLTNPISVLLYKLKPYHFPKAEPKKKIDPLKSLCIQDKGTKATKKGKNKN
jgi:hypothetical protein